MVPLLHNFHAIVLHEEILCREFYDDLLVGTGVEFNQSFLGDDASWRS